MAFDVALRDPGGGFDVVLEDAEEPPPSGDPMLQVWNGTEWVAAEISGALTI